MTGNNGYFQLNDPTANEIYGYEVHPSWWSRKYEYVWALKHASPGDVCADMGCGWHQRPLKDALSKVCAKVYAVDAHPGILELEAHDNMEWVVADISKDTGIEAGSLDRVYCISVIEDLGAFIWGALCEFARVLKRDGRIILTFDNHYDLTKPLGKYPGVNFEDFLDAMENAGLVFDGGVDMSKEDAVYHEDFNLCVFHCVLKKI